MENQDIVALRYIIIYHFTKFEVFIYRQKKVDSVRCYLLFSLRPTSFRRWPMLRQCCWKKKKRNARTSVMSRARLTYITCEAVCAACAYANRPGSLTSSSFSSSCTCLYFTVPFRVGVCLSRLRSRKTRKSPFVLEYAKFSQEFPNDPIIGWKSIRE